MSGVFWFFGALLAVGGWMFGLAWLMTHPPDLPTRGDSF